MAERILEVKDLRTYFYLTYLFIAHDLSVVRYISDRVAMIISTVIGLPLGVYSAVRQDTGGDYAGRTHPFI